MSDEGSSIVGQMKILNRKHQHFAKEGPVVTPCEAIRLCCEHGAGVAFSANFDWTIGNTEMTPVQEGWGILKDCEEFLRICCWDSDMEAENDYLVEEMPFHWNSEDGHIAVVLAAVAGRPEVFAVIEQDSSKTWKRELDRDGRHYADGEELSKQKPLRPKNSADSLRTNAPDREIGSSIWYAPEEVWNLGRYNEGKRRRASAEAEAGKKSRCLTDSQCGPAHGHVLSEEAVERVELDQERAGVNQISFLDHLALERPWNPLAFCHSPE